MKFPNFAWRLWTACLAYMMICTPPNSFNVSMMPCATFTAVNLNLYNGGTALLPIFTMGKAFFADGRRLLPLAIQAHHAVCDGYHIGRFLAAPQGNIDGFEG